MTDPTGIPNTPPPPPAYPSAPPPAAAPAGTGPVPGKTLGIVALILAFFFQLLGLILGIVALVQSRKAGVKNTPAVWAIVLSAVFLVIGIIVGIVLVTVALGAAAEIYEQCLQMGGGTQVINGVEITCN